MAIVALGLNVSFKDLKDHAFKPLIVIVGLLIFLFIGSIYVESRQYKKIYIGINYTTRWY